METSTAQDAPSASPVVNESVSNDIVTQLETNAAAAKKKAAISAEKAPTVAAAPVIKDGETQHDMSEDDFLSDEEWEKLSKKKRKFKSGDVEEDMTLADIYKNSGINKSLTTKSQQVAADKAEAARIKQEAETSQRQVQGLLQHLKDNPNALYDLAKNLGHDPDKLAIERAHQRYLYEKMTPEQKEIYHFRQQKAEFEANQAKAQEEQIQQELSAAEQTVFEESKALIDEGVKALGDDADFMDIDRIAQTSKYLYEKTGKVPTADEIAKNIRQRFDQEFKGRVAKMTAEELMGHLPKEIKSGLKELLLRMEAPRVPHGSSPMGSNPKPAQREKKVGINDYFNNLGK